MAESADDPVEAGSLGRVVAVVGKVGFVDDPLELVERCVVRVVAFEEGLEAAVAVVV